MPDLLHRISELKAQNNRFRDVIVRTSDNAHYWYKLWLGMGTEFHRGQQLLVEEIDRLRRQVGGKEWDGNSFDDYLDHMKTDWVDPKKHPANQSIEDVRGGIDVPPKHPDVLMKEAE